ncbi:hypothetical protein CTI12_AA397300 [Artemisia annua]|uniref:ATPase, F1/V1/A1 complex, alpha/beta subunit, Zinc knuckle CX2CX4HX4C n=1 Tax=Artemisia annua TaxID=35608 RepID=A0A2U1MBS7_ARTAN|nr:hypothetical protein CTI12_AA397300 [Artemisia annua]
MSSPELGDKEGGLNGNDENGGNEISGEDIGNKEVDNERGKEVHVEAAEEVVAATDTTPTTTITTTVSTNKLPDNENNGNMDASANKSANVSYAKAVRKLEFARVLVEFDVYKGFKDEIVIQYRNKDNVVKRTKTVKVEYMWKPDICSHCSVFGHNTKCCEKRPKSEEEMEEIKKQAMEKNNNEGFVDVQKFRRGGFRRQMGDTKKQEGNNGGMDRNGNVWKKKAMNNNHNQNAADKRPVQNNQQSPQKTWKLPEKEINAMRNTANKYVVLSDMNSKEKDAFNTMKDRSIVDQYLNMKLQPIVQVKTNWSKDMLSYFNTKWEEDRKKEREAQSENLEDVIDKEKNTSSSWTRNEVNGKDTTILN